MPYLKFNLVCLFFLFFAFVDIAAQPIPERACHELNEKILILFKASEINENEYNIDECILEFVTDAGIDVSFNLRLYRSKEESQKKVESRIYLSAFYGDWDALDDMGSYKQKMSVDLPFWEESYHIRTNPLHSITMILRKESFVAFIITEDQEVSSNLEKLLSEHHEIWF